MSRTRASRCTRPSGRVQVETESLAELNRIRVQENGEPLVEVRQVCPQILAERPPALVRQRVAEMLAQAQALLPPGHHLKVKWAHRGLAEQAQLYWRAYRRFRREHPSWPYSALRRHTNRFVHPPEGQELDMTSPFGWGPEVAATDSEEITPQARTNRQLLIQVMSAAGFLNYPGEWWHWSFGDSGWALRAGLPTCPYGPARPPEGMGAASARHEAWPQGG